MTFGKHRGKRIADIPHDYLAWCLQNIENLNPWLRAAMVEQLEAATRPSGPDAGDVVGRLQEQLKGWYRRASLKHHPDLGGSNAAQIIVNDVYESLSDVLGEMRGGS